jgi:hypothetical protein
MTKFYDGHLFFNIHKKFLPWIIADFVVEATIAWALVVTALVVGIRPGKPNKTGGGTVTEAVNND